MAKAKAKYAVKSLGDGLFRSGGDIYCKYPCLSFERIDGETSGKAIY